MLGRKVNRKAIIGFINVNQSQFFLSLLPIFISLVCSCYFPPFFPPVSTLRITAIASLPQAIPTSQSAVYLLFFSSRPVNLKPSYTLRYFLLPVLSQFYFLWFCNLLPLPHFVLILFLLLLLVLLVMCRSYQNLIFIYFRSFLSLFTSQSYFVPMLNFLL